MPNPIPRTPSECRQERKDILEHLGLKGDKSGEMSVLNALTALTKANQVVRAERKYRAA